MTRLVTIDGVPKPALMSMLHQAGVRLNEAAETLFADDRFTTVSEKVVVETVAVTVQSLGLPKGGTFASICERASSEGLTLCPLELGPHLRLQLTDQPEGSLGKQWPAHCAPAGSITVVSAPLADDDAVPKGFYLRRIEGTLWLRGYWSSPGHVWSPHDVLVFARAQHAA